MALANLSSGSANPGTGTPSTFTYTNSAACVIVANIVTLGGPGFVPITGVTDSAGVTWHRRSSITYLSPNFSGLSGGVNHVVQEVWWANLTATHGSAVTVSIAKLDTATNEASSTTISWATFTGSLVPATPWDINAALGSPATYSHASTATLPSKGWTVSSSAAFVLGFLHQMGATGNTNVSTAPTGFTFGSAHISIGNSTTGPMQNALAWSTSGQSGSGTETFNGSGTVEWALFSDALTSDSNGTDAAVGLTIHGTPVETFDNSGTASSVAATITTTVPTVVIAVITTYHFSAGGNTNRTVTGVSGGGLTWAKRSSSTGHTSTFAINQEVWWANATGALSAQAITASLSGAVSQNIDMMVFAVSGSQSPSSPWDVNVSFPATTTKMTSGTTATMTETGTTTSVKAMLLGFATYAWNSHTDTATPTSGYVDIKAPHIGTSLNSFWEQQTVNVAGSNSISWVNPQEFYSVTMDALSGDAPTIVNATGTIATSLTKASQSAAGKTSFTGTITTALTKASMSAAGTEKFTGTISTALTKASMSATGSQSFVVNSITTVLSGISQSLAGSVSSPTVSITGTIETDLSRFRQALSGAGVIVSGSIETDLSGFTQTASGQEVFSASITTTLSGISQEVDGHVSPLMIGTIVTRLTGITQDLVAEEDIIGHIATHLGAAGQLVSTDVEGLLIIEGPIVMNLSGFGQGILGGSLGTPGSGKWYSYRYLDS